MSPTGAKGVARVQVDRRVGRPPGPDGVGEVGEAGGRDRAGGVAPGPQSEGRGQAVGLEDDHRPAGAEPPAKASIHGR